MEWYHNSTFSLFLGKRYEVCVLPKQLREQLLLCSVWSVLFSALAFLYILCTFAWLFSTPRFFILSTVLLEQLSKLGDAAAAVYEVCPSLVSVPYPAQAGLQKQLCFCQNSKKSDFRRSTSYYYLRSEMKMLKREDLMLSGLSRVQWAFQN